VTEKQLERLASGAVSSPRKEVAGQATTTKVPDPETGGLEPVSQETLHAGLGRVVGGRRLDQSELSQILDKLLAMLVHPIDQTPRALGAHAPRRSKPFPTA
jgi:hypothetical protein